jgi:cytoskeletal protein CcmA (bactofilin family)
MQAQGRKLASRRTLDGIGRFTSSVAEESVFKGSFSGGENIVVHGTVEGRSDVNGVIVITETGKWLGELTADVVIVAGTVEGNIIAREKIELRSNANIRGNLLSPLIAIECGAVHVGHIDMKNIQQLKHFKEKRGPVTEL